MKWPFPRPRPRKGRFARVKCWLLRVCLALVAIPILWVGIYRWVDPPVTLLMVSEGRRLGDWEREWRDLEQISPHLQRAVIAAEDARFCDHYGFDFDAIRAALSDGGARGGSGITQQTAKNVFLWPGRTWLRKGLEAGFTVLIELFWSKRRILEIYLNVAETGEGDFGAEAIAQKAFGRPAADLDLNQAARIAAILPNPRARNPARLSAAHRKRAAAIADGAETLRRSGAAACVNR